MKKRKSVKQELALTKRKAMREYRTQSFNAVMEKNKIETILDMCSLMHRLTRKSLERIALREILKYSRFGFSPREIYKMLEGKNGKI